MICLKKGNKHRERTHIYYQWKKGNIYNSLKRKNIRKELWKAIFAHNSFYFYMTPPTPIGYNQNGTTGFQKSLI